MMRAALLLLAPLAALGQTLPPPDNKVKLHFSVAWLSFASFSDSKEVLSGTAVVQYEWDGDRGAAISDDFREIVGLPNFATGTPGRVKGPLLSSGANRLGINQFIGDFKQDISGTCYPFDTHTMNLEFTLIPPLPSYVEIHLFCGNLEGSRCKGYNAAGQEVNAQYKLDALSNQVVKIELWDHEDVSSVGFTWSKFTCTTGDAGAVATCTMEAQRNYWTKIKTDLTPGIIMLLVGFASFWVPVKQSMPRVATCMIALLTLTSKFISVAISLPPTGLSWVEEIYIIGMVVMLLNMLGHILSFRYDQYHQVIDEISLYVVFWVMLLWLSCSLWARGCTPILTGVFEAIITIFSTIALVTCLVIVCWRHRNAFRAKEKADEDQAPA